MKQKGSVVRNPKKSNHTLFFCLLYHKIDTTFSIGFRSVAVQEWIAGCANCRCSSLYHLLYLYIRYVVLRRLSCSSSEQQMQKDARWASFMDT